MSDFGITAHVYFSTASSRNGWNLSEANHFFSTLTLMDTKTQLKKPHPKQSPHLQADPLEMLCSRGIES